MLGAERRNRRRTAGLSQATLGAAVGLSRAEVSRVEAGQAPWLTVIHAAELLRAVGLELWAKAYPVGPPLRDAAHLKLLAEFESRLRPSITRSREWPIPNYGDRRAIDLVLAGAGWRIGVEAETVLADLQELEREIHLKQRDAGLERMVLVVRGSRRNRQILRGDDRLHRAFPVATREALAALAEGRPPDADAL